jgi:hypothetical protein
VLIVLANAAHGEGLGDLSCAIYKNI